MTADMNIEAERPLFEKAMLDDGKNVARAQPKYGGKYLFLEERWQGWLAARKAAPVVSAAGQFQAVGHVWYERVNGDFNANLDYDLVVDGEPLYRLMTAPAALVSDVGNPLEETLDADDIAKLRNALSWMGESTPESLEECEIYRTRLVRRLIEANLAARETARAANAEEMAPARQVKDHEVREAVNQLRDVATRFHATQQLRSRIQEIVMPLLGRGGAA